MVYYENGNFMERRSFRDVTKTSPEKPSKETKKPKRGVGSRFLLGLKKLLLRLC